MSQTPTIIDGPDADGFVWMRWELDGAMRSRNLGRHEDVASALKAWLQQTEDGAPTQCIRVEMPGP